MRSAIVLAIIVGAVVVGLALLPLPGNQRPAATKIGATNTNSNPVQLEFMQGGTVALDLEAGDYQISPTEDDKVTVSYRVNGDPANRSVRIRSGVNGQDARIVIETPNNGFHAEISVPRKSNLYARLTAGNLTVDGIEGSKDIESRAGNVTIDVGDPAKYGPVYASVSSGNLQANPWAANKSGLVRSFSSQGHGPYGLHAHVGAGNLVLVSKGK